MSTFPLEFHRGWSHLFCSKIIWVIFHLYVIQIWKRVLLKYKLTVHQLSFKNSYLYLNAKISNCDSAFWGWGKYKGGSISFFNLSTHSSQFVSWPALGMEGFLMIDYWWLKQCQTVITKNRIVHFLPHYPDEKCFHKLFAGKSIFDINKYFLLIDFVSCYGCVCGRNTRSKHKGCLDLNSLQSLVARKISFQGNVSNCYAVNEIHQTQLWQPLSEPDLISKNVLILTQFLWLHLQ